jgi:hypothetical protein
MLISKIESTEHDSSILNTLGPRAISKGSFPCLEVSLYADVLACLCLVEILPAPMLEDVFIVSFLVIDVATNYPRDLYINLLNIFFLK